MIQLGFASAILPDLSLEEVLRFAAETGYECVEVMCWPVSKAERRYAGITHIDVTTLDDAAVARIGKCVRETGVEISALGYYPNCLAPDAEEARRAVEHVERLLRAAPRLGLTRVNTFIGRDWTRSVDENWPRLLDTWRPLVKVAEAMHVRIGIENCPMLFSQDEWPGGKNIATSPKIWRRLFEDLGSPNIGLNYDPSHMVWQQMDYLAPMRDFAERLSHIHLKDVRVDRHKLDQVGILAHPLEYHTPKLPGLGDVDWGQFFSTLLDAGYRGPACVEVEDRAYEGSLDDRKESLRQSYRYLRNFVPLRA
jgi:sugar phosphate isomerase/epimerase